MYAPRTVDTNEVRNMASDVTGETAAARAASSVAFRSSHPGYAEKLLRISVGVFDFADGYRLAYSDNSNIKKGIYPFYCDFNGYQVIIRLYSWKGCPEKLLNSSQTLRTYCLFGTHH